MNNTKESNIDKTVFILFLILGMLVLSPISPKNLNTSLHNSYNFANPIAFPKPKPIRSRVSNPVVTNGVTNTNRFRTNSLNITNI
jgi:hypothetical protein